MTDRASATFTPTEPAETPWHGSVFGCVAMAPFVGGLLGVWLAPDPRRGTAPIATLLWLFGLGFAALALSAVALPLAAAAVVVVLACLAGLIVLLMAR